MVLIGLTGGVASGKSTVSQVLKEEGAYVIDADRIARDLVTPDSPVSRELVQVFGKEILCQDGSIDRKRLAARVFSDPEERRLLNRILHPKIKEAVCYRIREVARTDPAAIVIVDAALLIDVGWHREVDKVIVVTSSTEQQIERMEKRDGLATAEARRILAAQMTQEERLKVADFVIPNEGSLEDTIKKTREVFDEIRKTSHDRRKRSVDRT
jgi:dephospho-CoA kinase